jgi:hypothetical protein
MIRVTVSLTICAVAVMLAGVTSAGASTKHPRHHVRHRPPITTIEPVPAYGGPYAAPGWTAPYALRARPYQCMTDEGGGRLYPCDYGSTIP